MTTDFSADAPETSKAKAKRELEEQLSAVEEEKNRLASEID